MKVAIIIPCYNEVKTIGKVVSDFHRELPDAEIYVFDNNSTDGSATIAEECGATVKKESRQGKGFVVQSMFATVDADVYVMVDGDDTYPANRVKDLIEPVKDGRADMVLGDRLSTTYFQVNSRAMHNSGNRLVRMLINKLFNGNVHDILTGYRAFSRDFVKRFQVLSGGFEIETEMTIHALDKRYRIAEVPVEYTERTEDNPSKLNTFSDGFRVLKMIAVLFRDYKPFYFFSIVAGCLTLIGLGFIIPVLVEYSRTGLVERFPTLIVCCGVFLMAILMFCVGIILEVLSRQNRVTLAYLNDIVSRR